MRSGMMTAMALALAMPGAGMAQTPGQGAAQPAADGRTVANAVRKAIAENYVVPERKAALDAALARGIAAGRYDRQEPQELARRITEDLFAVAKDKHLGLSHNPVFAAQAGHGPVRDDSTSGAFWARQAQLRNHGVTEMRVLDGNVRLVTYDGFHWTGPESAAVLDRAAEFLAGGDAIIIDIRGNGGGSPDAVRRLTSYFVAPDTKLVSFYMRNDPPVESRTDKTPPKVSLAGKPAYVLTSGNAASAAEEFASHVAGFGFATLVGEPTAGAAYRNDLVPMPGGFVLSVSVGRPELPKGGNWEGTGVAPAIRVPAAQALDRAMQDALARLAAKAQGPERTELEWRAATLAAKAARVVPGLPLASYAGRYGPRTVSVEGDRLMYQRDGGPKSALVALEPQLFAIEADPRTRVRFTLSGGSVTGFVIERADGSRTESPRG